MDRLLIYATKNNRDLRCDSLRLDNAMLIQQVDGDVAVAGDNSP